MSLKLKHSYKLKALAFNLNAYKISQLSGSHRHKHKQLIWKSQIHTGKKKKRTTERGFRELGTQNSLNWVFVRKSVEILGGNGRRIRYVVVGVVVVVEAGEFCNSYVAKGNGVPKIQGSMAFLR